MKDTTSSTQAILFYPIVILLKYIFYFYLFNKMKNKNQLFNSAIGIFSFMFFVISVVSFISGELIFGIKEGGRTVYVSIFFISLVFASSIFVLIMLLKSERKIFLYILFCLPFIVLTVIRLFDIFTAPMDYLLELIMFLTSSVSIVVFIITLVFYSRKKSIKALTKKKEKLQEAIKEEKLVEAK